MKFFTPAWRKGELPEDREEEIVAHYAGHIKALLPKLPPAVVSFTKEASIHDGIFRQVVFHPAKNTLGIHLRCGDLQVGYYDLDLLYSQIILSQSEFRHISSLVRSTREESLYDEFDVNSSHVFVHRILFSLDSEIEIKFGGFQYRKVTQPDRRIPEGIDKVVVIGKASG